MTEGEVTLYANVEIDENVYLPNYDQFNYTSPSKFSVSFSGISLLKKTIKTHIYVKRENEPYLTKIRGRFKKAVLNYFGDCYGLIKRIDDHEFRRANFDELVDYYNNYCAD